MARGDPALPLEQLVPYMRGARFAAVAMRLRHPDCSGLPEDAARYIAMVDRYREAAVATYRLRREREAGGPAARERPQ